MGMNGKRGAAVQSHAVDRRCAMVREGGQQCRGTPARGERYCHAHRRYSEAARTVVLTIPLIDDAASVTFVRSQVVRAMALGSIPPGNGRVMLEACRDAERELNRRVDREQVALRYAFLADKMGSDKLNRYMAEYFEGAAARARQAAGETLQADEVMAAGEAQESRDAMSGATESAAVEALKEDEAAAVEEGPVEGMHESVFPEVKQQWDRALQRMEGEITRMVSPAKGQSWREFLEQKKVRDAAVEMSLAPVDAGTGSGAALPACGYQSAEPAPAPAQ